MAQNWQNNGETVRVINDGSILSHSAADVKSGDLVLFGASNTAVVLKGVAMTDIVLAANVGELKYNEGSICRIGEWLFNAILSADAGQFESLHYNMSDKIFIDSTSDTQAAISAIFMHDPKVEPKGLVDASGIIDMTLTEAGDGSTIVNEVFEITITKSSDIHASTPVEAEFSIVGNNSHTTAVTGLATGAANADVFGDTNTIDLQLDLLQDVYEGQKFWIATIGDNSGTDVVQDAGVITEATVKGPHMAIPVSTVGKGLNQDEGPQGNVGKIPVLINP